MVRLMPAPLKITGADEKAAELSKIYPVSNGIHMKRNQGSFAGNAFIQRLSRPAGDSCFSLVKLPLAESTSHIK